MKRVVSLSLAFMVLATSVQAAIPIYRRINLTCANPGSHQDVAKTPIITNTSTRDLAATVKIYWEASDGDKGYVYGPLKVNESKSGLGSAGNGYSCTAYYNVRLP